MHFLEDIYIELDGKQGARAVCSCRWVSQWTYNEARALEEWEQHRLASLFPQEQEEIVHNVGG
jgi:hypothetical protein